MGSLCDHFFGGITLMQLLALTGGGRAARPHCVEGAGTGEGTSCFSGVFVARSLVSALNYQIAF